MRPTVAADDMPMLGHLAHQALVPRSIFPDHEERRLGVVFGQILLDLGGVARVGAVIERERDDLLLEASRLVQGVAADETFGYRLIGIEVGLECGLVGVVQSAKIKQR